MNLAVPIEVGLTKSRIVGNLPPGILEALRDQVSFRVEGAFFSPHFKKGQWDGRKHLVTEKGQSFATGLLDRVIAALHALGVETQTVDNRKFGAPVQFMPMLADEPMRDYQARAIKQLIEHMNGTCRIATGGGKTRVGVGVIAALERPALFLVHRRDLLHQTLGVLRNVMQYPELVGQVGDGVYEPNVITVATIQTICAALNIKPDEGEDAEDATEVTGAALHKDAIEKMLALCEVVICDECHHAPASTIYKVLEKIKNAPYRIGLSATDWRDDGADMMIEAAFGPRLVDIDLSALIGWGYLVPAEIFMHEMATGEKINPRQSKNWNSVYAHYITKNDAFHKQVVDQAHEWYWNGRTILTLVERIQHGEILAHDMNARGMETVFLSGKDSVDVRLRVFEDVMKGRLRSLVATSIADEGLDLPALDALILAGGSKSSTRAYQRIGRIIRPFAGKTKGLVADYRCRDHEWLDSHARRRLYLYKRERGFDIHVEKK